MQRPTLSSRANSQISSSNVLMPREHPLEYQLLYKTPNFRVSQTRTLSQTQIEGKSNIII